MKKELTERIDWVAYRKELEKEIQNERLYCMGGGNDVALHEKNMEELVEELDNINNGLYGDIIDKYENYMGDAEEHFKRFFKNTETVDWKNLKEKNENDIKNDYNRISDISFRPADGGRKFIRCKIDGEWQSSVRMSYADSVNIDKGLIKPAVLARIYFKDVLHPEQELAKGLKR